MIFAHRGLVTKDSPQNSIASLKAAVEGGFDGIEFDLWFVDGEILIKHDQPKKSEKLPTLREYFSFKNKLTYWLDFKNLDKKNAKLVFESVLIEAKKAKINRDKLFLIPFELDYDLAAYFYDQAKEVFGGDVQFGAVCELAENIADLQKFCLAKEVKFLSVFYGLIDEDFVEKFSLQKIFAWTVNDKKILKKLENLGVKNFASDLSLTDLCS
jgi:glycerophosphoryl diester phosphodiesterase